MHGANMKIIFITFTLFKTSRHVRSKLCPEHCLTQAKADVELCCLPYLSTRADVFKLVDHRNLRCSALRGLHCLRLNVRFA